MKLALSQAEERMNISRRKQEMAVAGGPRG
jgi:hypothetical protein